MANTATLSNLERYRDKLRTMRDRINGEVDSVAESINEDLNPAGKISNAPVHLADEAPENIDADIEVLETGRGMLDEIQAALRRIDDGSYGVCTTCGQPIAEERLEALPYASQCVPCASGNRRRGTNPSTEARFDHNRRAGVRDDELLPDQSNNDAGDISAQGTPGGGMASGGLAGSNAGDGSPENGDLENAMSYGIMDHTGDREEGDEPESGPSGGAAGGTPAGKRSGRRMHDPK